MGKTKYILSIFKENEFKEVRQLSELEFVKYSEYIVKLILLRNDENLFKIVVLNYTDLISKIEEVTNQLSEGNINTSEQQYLHLEINRLILNLLSSIRTYLDHTETRLKREYGITSDEYKIFKSETSIAYDENFAYRFLYKLRNYSQHCGLPAGSLQTNAFTENEVPKYVLKLSLLRDDLLKNFEWGNPITEELRIQEEIFDILSLIKTKFNLLEKINENIKDVAYKHYRGEGFELLNLLQEIVNKDGAPCILKTVEVEKNKTTLSLHWFPFESITKITGIRLY
jgi:hypothetical protein